MSCLVRLKLTIPAVRIAQAANLVANIFQTGEAGLRAYERWQETCEIPWGELFQTGLSGLGIIGSAHNLSRYVPRRIVWDDIRATANVVPGSEIPATFEMSVARQRFGIITGDQRFWVNSNASEHMIQDVISFGDSIGVSFTQPMQSQAMLQQFNAAVEEAVRGGIRYNERITTPSGYQLEFRRPPSADSLPVVIHARRTSK